MQAIGLVFLFGTSLVADEAGDLLSHALVNEINLTRHVATGIKLNSTFSCDIFGSSPVHYDGEYVCISDKDRWTCTLRKKEHGVMQLARIVAYNGGLYQSYSSENDSLTISKRNVFPYMWYGRADVSPFSLMGFLLYNNGDGAEDSLYAPNLSDILDPKVWSDFCSTASVSMTNQKNSISYRVAAVKNRFSKHAGEFVVTFDKSHLPWPAKVVMKRDQFPLYVVATLVDMQPGSNVGNRALDDMFKSIPSQIKVETRRVDTDAVVERIVHQIKSIDSSADVDPSIFSIDPQMAGKVDDLDEGVLLPTGK